MSTVVKFRFFYKNLKYIQKKAGANNVTKLTSGVNTIFKIEKCPN